MISDLDGSLRSRYFLNVANIVSPLTMLRMKGHVLNHARAHLKVPD